MTAEIIAIGSELLTPRRIDTNSLFLTRKLNEVCIELVRKTVVGDDSERIAAEIQRARESSDLVILTGGLGPTLDDVTRDATSKATGQNLIYHEHIIELIRERFSRRGRKMPDINRRQGYILDGADILDNHMGTAPGQWFEDEKGILILLPGPPRELEPMVQTECCMRFEKLDSKHRNFIVVMRVSGISESEVDERIGPLYSSEPNVTTTILAAPGDIQIYLNARGRTDAHARVTAEVLAKKIEDELGNAIYTRGTESLEGVVGRRLRELGLTLTVVESCTGGLLAQRLTSIPGSSDYFLGGWVAYAEDFKKMSLAIPKTIIGNYGAVSKETAVAMACCAKQKSGADISVSVTGVAGPTGGSESISVGTVFIGLVDLEGDVESWEYCFSGERSLVRTLATQSALERLLQKLRIVENFSGDKTL